MSTYQRFQELPLSERKKRCEDLNAKHPNKIPIVIDRASKSRLTGLPSFRFVSKPTTKFSHFSNQIRCSLALEETEQLFFVTSRGNLIKPESLVGDLAAKEIGEDGFLYLEFREVQSFGMY